MNTRRSFLKRLATAVAVIAIAPEIAFRTKLALPAPASRLVPMWIETVCTHHYRSPEYIAALEKLAVGKFSSAFDLGVQSSYCTVFWDSSDSDSAS